MALDQELLSTNLAEGGAVAEKSFAVSVLVGPVEVFVGMFSLSIALIADGVQSFADAVISLIVWIGLRFSRKGQMADSTLVITGLKPSAASLPPSS